MQPHNMEKILSVIGENVDRLCTLELRPASYSHGVIHPLYSAAREVIGEPLTLAAAKRIVSSVKAGDIVLLTTGAGDMINLPKGETDGPLGLAAVTRMIAEGLRATPVVLTEQKHLDNVEATLVGCGIGIRELEIARQVPFTATVLPFPADEDEAKRESARLISELEPKAVIAIEKQGPNAAGVTHSATGIPKGPERARIEHLIDAATEQNILTVGVGDNGNEIGYGLIQEAVWKYKQFGRKCQCPCGQGLATVVATDVLVVAGTSNWGAYGIEACIAAVLGKPELIHSRQSEELMLMENVRHGGVDASTRRQIPQVDGTSLEVQLALNDLFRAIVTYGLADPSTRRSSTS